MESTQPRPPLRRSSSDRMIGGVCGGLARTLGIDPVIVRVFTAVLAVLGGAGIAAYIIAWILVPNDEDETVLDLARTGRGRNRFPQFLLVLLLALAALSLFAAVWPSGDGIGFLVFVIVAVLAWQAINNDWFARPSSNVQDPADAASEPVARDAAARPRSVLGSIVWNLLAVAVGIMLALRWADVVDFTPRAMLTVALAIVGLGLLVSAFIGRARGLIALGLVLALVSLPVNVHDGTDIGDRMWTPVASAAPISYDLGAGNATLDLSQLVAASIEDADVRVRMGVGSLTVLLAPNARYGGSIDVGVGEIQLPDEGLRDGMNLRLPVDVGSEGPMINLDIELGVGSVEVQYA